MTWQILGVVGPIGIGCLAVLATFLGWLSRKLDKISDHLAEQDSEIAVIKHEVFENSGKSMRDRIEATAKDVEYLKASIGNRDSR